MIIMGNIPVDEIRNLDVLDDGVAVLLFLDGADSPLFALTLELDISASFIPATCR